jgi:glycine dehydrogenase subunit 1
MAEQNLHKARYAMERLQSVPGCRPGFTGAIFNEFALELPDDAEQVASRLQERGILAGVPLGRYYPDLRRALLVCVTEMNRVEEIDALAEALREVL